MFWVALCGKSALVDFEWWTIKLCFLVKLRVLFVFGGFTWRLFKIKLAFLSCYLTV
jgi:hypothetical protein